MTEIQEAEKIHNYSASPFRTSSDIDKSNRKLRWMRTEVY